METYDREPGKLLDESGEVVATGVADIDVVLPRGGKLKDWSGTFSIGSGSVGFDIAKARIVLDNGKAGDIVVTHCSASVVAFQGSGPLE